MSVFIPDKDMANPKSKNTWIFENWVSKKKINSFYYLTI